MNHTPGPWRTDSSQIKALEHGHWYSVASVNSKKLTADGNSANARLIACAPELLSALQWALDQIEDDLDPDHQAALEAAHAVVAKALGH
jgi:hypothetical protein